MIPWEKFETEYAELFSKGIGSPAKSFRMALGALIIKERLGTSDVETVEQIRENPYLQFFLGLSEYSDKAPFEASMMVHFRKRLTLEIIGRMNEEIVSQSNKRLKEESSEKVVSSGEEQENSQGKECLNEKAEENNEPKDEPEPNQGQLLLDASCAPADIRYPTDLSLLNQARELTEVIIDSLYKQLPDKLEKKPRTYRRQARKRYLQVAKQRRASRKAMRKAIRQQLGYVRRNLNHIDALVEAGVSLTQLSQQRYRRLLVISEIYRQQQSMYDQNVQRIDDRIVSQAQPHVRPIVRGKAGTPVEFGAKISVSCADGKVFLDRLSWDNFNESGDLQKQIEEYKERYGYYPKSVHVDQIYRTRVNRAYCKERSIRISGPPLGRPKKQEEEQSVIRKQALEDNRVRNQIEGKFGQAKRRFSLGLIKSKLSETAETAIAIIFLVMNLEQVLHLFFVFGEMASSFWRFLSSIKISQAKKLKRELLFI